jgi:hypothetical protein
MKMQVCEYRKLVDYTNKTQNEPRIFENDETDSRIYYPLGNVYINKYNGKMLELPYLFIGELSLVEKEWFEERLQDHQMEYAIKHLQVEALKKFIQKNHKSVLFVNPFFHLFYTIYPVEKNIEATKEIIKILIENYDDNYDLITKLEVNKKENKFVLDLMYEMLPQDDENLCSICHKTEPKKFLIHTCLCKTPAHAGCLIELNNYKKLDTCMVCHGKYKVNEPITRTISGIIIKEEIDNTLYFPFQDLYYEPLINNIFLKKYEGMSRLTMAIMYLQVERVKELLQEQEVLDELPNYYFGYPDYKQTPLHSLCSGNLPTNASISFNGNLSNYMKITKLLLDTKKIDKSAKDAFGKTARDIIIENNTQIFLYLGF